MRNFLFAALLLLTPSLRAAQPPAAVSTMPDTVFGYASASGDWVGQGESRGYTPRDATFSIRGNGSQVWIRVQGTQIGDYWMVELAAPPGEMLHPRTYADADATNALGRAPGLYVYGNARSCGRPMWGEFGIRQIGFDVSGNVTSIEASFTQRCQSPDAPPMSGVIRYQTPPLSFTLDGDVGDPLTKGVHKGYYNDTSIFDLHTPSLTNDLWFTIRGQHDDWLFDIAPPSGQSFKQGKYAVAALADGTHAKLDLHGNGVGCNTIGGTLIVQRVETDQNGKVNKFAASFEQHCDGAKAAARGVLHYGL